MTRPNCNLTVQEILDTYFLENRARLLEIASFLDRVDRGGDGEPRQELDLAAEGAGAGKGDFRYRAFIRALGLLLEPGGGRTRAIQLCFSDQSTEPVESALGLKATGAWAGGDP